jgi:hypothetical protein
MKSSFHSLIPFLSLFCNCQFRRLNSIQFLYSQAHIPAGWRLETRLDSMLLNTTLQKICTDHAENVAYIVKEACLLIRFLAMDVLLRALAPAGMCLPSRYLAMGLYVTLFVVRSSWICNGHDKNISRPHYYWANLPGPNPISWWAL